VSELLEICKKVKVLAFFGSYTRGEDFVEGISDINIFALSDDKSVLVELASFGFSPIVLSEYSFKRMCEEGDPICYYALYDSNVICGEFPFNIRFNLSKFTCERIRKAILPFLSLSITAFIRQDEISTVENSFRALRNLVQWKSCESNGYIPIKVEEIKETCTRLSVKICNELSDIVLVRKLKSPLSLWSLDKIVEGICNELGIGCVKPSKLLEENKNIKKVDINEDGSVTLTSS